MQTATKPIEKQSAERPVILATKLYAPKVRPALVHRPHLVEQLNQGLDRKLTIISAPAGFGKTTLLAEWLAGVDRSVAWVSLDKSDNDFGRFFTYAIVSLHQIIDDIGVDVLVALGSTSLPPIETLMAALINELNYIPEPVVLVFDDFHLIENKDIHQAFLFLLDHLPRQLHLILAGRADPPWPLARMRVMGDINEIRTNQLRFSLGESQRFFNEVMELGLDQNTVNALDQRTEGWVAGLQMAALSMSDHSHIPAFIEGFTGSNRFILDYLVEEVLDRQTPEVRDFLLKTSILDRLTADLCQALLLESENDKEKFKGDGRSLTVSPTPDASKILHTLEQSNLFIFPLDDDRCWYRYHHLFADLLRGALSQQKPEQLPALHLKASGWFEAAGHFEMAVQHAFKAGDVQHAATLIENHGQAIMTRGMVSSLSSWLELLPQEIICGRPWLCLFYAWTRHWFGHHDEVIPLLELAVQGLTARTGSDEASSVPDGAMTEQEWRLAGTIATIRAYHFLDDNILEETRDHALLALELLPEDDYMRSAANVALGAYYWAVGDGRGSESAFTAASSAVKKYGYQLAAPTYLGMDQVKKGRLKEAYEIFRQAREKARSQRGRLLPASGFPSIKMGDLQREWNNLEGADPLINKGVEMCRLWGQNDIIIDALINLARLRLAQGDLIRAAESLDSADDLIRSTAADPYLTTWYDECRLRLWLKEAKFDRLTGWLAQSDLTPDGELDYGRELPHLNLAFVLVVLGKEEKNDPVLSDALYLLDRLLAAAEKAGWVHHKIKCLILTALAHHTLGDDDLATVALSRALSLASPGGYVRAFTDEGPAIAKLLNQIARTNPSPYVNLLLDASQLPQTLEPAPLTRTPSSKAVPPYPVDPLSDRELEVLHYLSSTLSVTEIAQALFIAPSTARSHVKSIYSKLDVHSRLEAIQRAEDLGLI